MTANGWRIAAFELRYQCRQPLLAISAVAFLALGLLLASSDVGFAAAGGSGATLRTAPIAVLRLMPIVSLLSLIVVNAFVSGAALRDFERRSEMLFFTKPIGLHEYVGGRFIGALTISAVVLSLAVVGLMLGAQMPWQPATRVGAFSWSGYGLGWVTILVPNLVIMGSLFFGLALWTRRMSVTFLGVVFFIGMQDAVEVVAETLDKPILGALLEPSGVVALDVASRFWSVAEQNTRLPGLGGVLLWNRVLWLTLAAIVLVVSVVRFTRSARSPHRGSVSPNAAHDAVDSPAATAAAPIEVPSARPDDEGGHAEDVSAGEGWLGLRYRQLLLQARVDVSEILPRAAFLAMLAFGLMMVAAIAWIIGAQEGTASNPLTYLMIDAIGSVADLILVAMLALFGSELVFNQRTRGISEIYDALPVPTWVLVFAKLVALVSMIATFLLAAVTVTIGVQLVKGFHDIEPLVYLQGLTVVAVPLVLLAALVLFLNVAVGHRLIGLLLTVFVLLSRVALPRLGFESNLYRFAGHPELTHSAFTGYGRHWASFLSFMTYWGAAASILVVATVLLWPRGHRSTARERLVVLWRRFQGPMRGALAIGLLGMLTAGTWIVHTTHVRRPYVDRDRIVARLADYERRYEAYRDLPLPRVTSVNAEVDIFPRMRTVAIRGRYRLENAGSEPIDVLPITMTPRWVEGVLPVYGGVTLEAISLPAHEVIVADPARGFYAYRLERPIAPGAHLELGFTVAVDQRAFSDNRHDDLVVENGTFFTNREFFPAIGYARSNELVDAERRRVAGLPPPSGLADRGDETARQRNYIHADWIDFEAVVSTSADQIAIAPGNLVARWEADGRRFFRYRTEAPIIFLVPFHSGAYTVTTATSTNATSGDVGIEVYAHPDHMGNVDRFVETAQRSLAYLESTLGPYPHDQLRIVEIPRFHGEIAFAFAQVIAFSEAWSFTADLDSGDLDWLTAILTHEIAHQWWNHQLVPADVAGATLIAESLPQYAATKVLEAHDGATAVGRFSRYHLDRYLEHRGRARRQELPLARVGNQGHLHYHKASIALQALDNVIGRENLETALRTFLEAYRFAGPPYPTSEDLLRHVRMAAPPDRVAEIDALFETVTLFDHRIVDARAAPREDETFRVEIDLTTAKDRDDGFGTLTPVPIDDRVQIGIFGTRTVDGHEQETLLALETHRIVAGEQHVTLDVDAPPTRVAIDPYHQFVDRNPADNTRALRPLAGPVRDTNGER